MRSSEESAIIPVPIILTDYLSKNGFYSLSQFEHRWGKVKLQVVHYKKECSCYPIRQIYKLSALNRFKQLLELQSGSWAVIFKILSYFSNFWIFSLA